MKIRIIRPLTVFVIACMLCVSTTAFAATSKTVNLGSLIIQAMSNWCWAACSEMVFIYKGVTNKEQCEIAEWWWEHKSNPISCEPNGSNYSCCPTSSSCNNPLDNAAQGEAIWDCYGNIPSTALTYYLQYESSNPSTRTVITTIDENNPIGIMLDNYNLEAYEHAVLISGYWYTDNIHYCEVYDPMPGGWGVQWRLYSDLVAAQGWEETLYIEPGC